MKKFISIILCGVLFIVFAFSFYGCNNTSTTPVSQWGFENLADYGNTLIRAQDYNLEEGYIVVSSTKFQGFLFKDGDRFSVHGAIDADTGEIDTSGLSSGSFDYSFRIVDNDNLDLNDGYTEMIIRNRIVSDNENTVIFDAYIGHTNSGYLVPYTLIDFEQAAEETTYIRQGISSFDKWEEKGYKLFLK